MYLFITYLFVFMSTIYAQLLSFILYFNFLFLEPELIKGSEIIIYVKYHEKLNFVPVQL